MLTLSIYHYWLEYFNLVFRTLNIRIFFFFFFFVNGWSIRNNTHIHYMKIFKTQTVFYIFCND